MVSSQVLVAQVLGEGQLWGEGVLPGDRHLPQRPRIEGAARRGHYMSRRHSVQKQEQ